MKNNLLLAILVLFSFPILAQTYGLDSSFGVNGIQSFNRSNGNSSFYDVEVHSDKKVFTAGVIKNSTLDAFVVKLNQNGILENAFGTNGKAMIDLGGDETINDIAIQSDGKIVACGLKTQSGQVSKFILMRLNQNGSLDNTFGAQGVVEFSQLNGTSTTAAVYRNVRIQADGKIVAIGYAYVSNTEYRGVVHRFKSNGSLDSTFGVNGFVSVKFTNGSHNYGESLHVMQNGKILILGSSYFNAFAHRMMRLKNNGVVDSTFGVNGIRSSTFNGFTNVTPNWIVEQANGSIYTVGYAYNGTKYKVYASKHLSNGHFDSAFATNGIANFDASINNNYAYDAFLHSNGNLSIPGEAYTGNASVACVFRIDSLGGLVNTFGNNGISSFAFADDDYGNAVSVDGDSLYIVGGIRQIEDRFSQGYISKIDNIGNLISGYSGTGIRKIGSGKSVSTPVNIIPLSNGNMYITGIHENSNDDQFVAKIDSNGKPVSRFGNNGFANYDIGTEELRDAILLENESVLLGSMNVRQTINFTAPVVTLTGPVQYSLSIIDSNGVAQTGSQKNFPITANQFTNLKAVRQDNNGKFVVLASSSQAVVSTFYLIRHNSDLSLDNSFGNNSRISMLGRTTSNFTGLGDIQIAPDNDVVVLNWFSSTFTTPYSNFTVKKYKENGNLDVNFGSNGIFTNLDSVGKDPSSASHLWKFNNGYYVDYIKDGISKIVHINFAGSIGSFGIAVLDSARVSSMQQMSDSSFIVVCYKGPEVKIYRFLANGTRDMEFNKNGVLNSIPFAQGNSIKGFVLNADKSLVLYHQINEGSNPSSVGLSKYTLKKTENTSIELNNVTSQVNVYPNPFSEGVYIELSGLVSNSSDYKFTLTDLNGRLIPIRVELLSDSKVYMESSINLPAGMYVIYGKSDTNEVIRIKIVKY